MQEFESPTYYLDLSDKTTRSRIENAKVNQPMKVLVRKAENPTDEPIIASFIRVTDKECVIKVITTRGSQTHTRGWEELVIDLEAASK